MLLLTTLKTSHALDPDLLPFSKPIDKVVTTPKLIGHKMSWLALDTFQIHFLIDSMICSLRQVPKRNLENFGVQV